MRADYGLYFVAAICFIIATLPHTNQLLNLNPFMSLTLTVLFAALGLISIILGYSMRPRPVISIPKAPKPVLPPSPPSSMPSAKKTTTTSPSKPAPPMIPKEETAKPETKTRRKRTRKRRKKA